MHPQDKAMFQPFHNHLGDFWLGVSPIHLHILLHNNIMASCVDDIKFVAGYGVYLGEVLISWSSKKQFGVARSSSVSALATNPIYHPRTKHMELDVHFVQNKVLEKKLEIRYVPSHDQVVNCLIKGLTPIRFKFLISKLNVVTSSFHLRGKVKENG
uniref:Uncharacterized protein n=1 Tax=Cannabis sativa TaxID=3483 RepID=A0A803QRG7_CANSA